MRSRILAAGTAWLFALGWLLHAPAAAAEPIAAQTPGHLPTFAELEAAGATVGEIRIAANDIFDTSNPLEDKWLFRLANQLHKQTRPEVIASALLFKRGEKVSARLIEETERSLRSNRYLYDVQIRPVEMHEGNVVDIEVRTRDTWSLEIGAGASRQGGANSSGLRINEYNVAGTGIALGFGHSNGVDRSSNEFQIADPRLFHTWTSLAYSHASNSDGSRDSFALLHPFHELNARWAAGLSASKDDRIDAVYVAGEVASQYRHRQDRAEAYAGLSEGLQDGWVQRWSGGIALQQDRYAAEPGLVAPATLAADEKLLTPFVRMELIEDRFERELNRNLIGRPEFFALGFASTVQLGVASRNFGSSRNALLYTAAASRGFEPAEGQLLMTATRLTGQYYDGSVRRQQFGAQSQFYLPQSGRWLFAAALSGDVLLRPQVNDALLLGGDNGLRGYPLRYQAGTRRVLATVEERYFTDLYLWQLFRIGAAAYLDVGRAWGGDLVNAGNPGWLSNVGLGLRIVNSRAAFSEVLHIDLAYPLNTTPDMRRLQLLVKTRTSF